METPKEQPASSPMPQSAPAPIQTTVPAGKKSAPVWVWILGGCLVICLLIVIGVMALGYWGVKKVKKEIREYEPQMEEIQESVEKLNGEAQELQKKTQEVREGMPAMDVEVEIE